MLAEFRKPHNLPVTDFSLLAGKSRQQIYKDVEKRRLLALSVGARGQGIPDWQLDVTRQKLTQALRRKHGMWAGGRSTMLCQSRARRLPAGPRWNSSAQAINIGRLPDVLLDQLDLHG